MGSSLLSSDPSSSTSFPSEPYPTSEPEPYQTTDSAPYQARDPELNQLRDSEAMAATTTIPSEGLTDLMATTCLASPPEMETSKAEVEEEEEHNGGDLIAKLMEESRNLTKEEKLEQMGPKRAKTG